MVVYKRFLFFHQSLDAPLCKFWADWIIFYLHYMDKSTGTLTHYTYRSMYDNPLIRNQQVWKQVCSYCVSKVLNTLLHYAPQHSLRDPAL